MPLDLAALVQHFVMQSTPELVQRVSTSLEGGSSWADALPLPHFPNAGQRTAITRIVDGAQQSGYSPREVAIALRAALAVDVQHRKLPQLELVMSGPPVPPYEFRRTDETILEVVRSAQQTLTLVSFALFRVHRLAIALKDAAQSGTRIRFFIDPDTLPRDFQSIYGDLVLSGVTVYAWEPRSLASEETKPVGRLHAKIVIGDRNDVFLTSANLTERAMSSNFEVGMLVRGGGYASRIEQMLDTYLSTGLFRRLQ